MTFNTSLLSVPRGHQTFVLKQNSIFGEQRVSPDTAYLPLQPSRILSLVLAINNPEHSSCTMLATDCSGQRVSLLNEPMERSNSSRGSSEAPPFTPPELQQTYSYDSGSSPRSDPISPATPTLPYEHHYGHDYHPYMYGGYTMDQTYDDYVARRMNRKYSSFSDSAASGSSYDEVAPAKLPPAPLPPAPERTAKRYPCRFRDSHGCEKTFTTSGHASRHSKIHTAEKGVQCTYTGCHKKFTRADNMKQHLETHYKDKSRGKTSSSRRAAHSRTSSTQRTRERPTALNRDAIRDGPHHAVPTPLVSPATGAWDLRGLNSPLMSHPAGYPAPPPAPAPVPGPRDRLETLALAAARCGEP